MDSKNNECFKIFEQFIEFVENNNKFLKKISGDVHTSLGMKLIQIFSRDEECLEKVKDYVENRSEKLELDEEGYFDLTKLKGVSKEDMDMWFSKFVFDNGRTVGKGEVLLSILFNNVFKTPLGENIHGEPGDLYMSKDNGKTASGRIEVKSALPGGFKFNDFIRPIGLEKVEDGDKLLKVYKKFMTNPLENSAMDKKTFIKLCAYCIARYMHGQYPKVEDYWLVIFDNQPYINSRGNIHGTESVKIKRVINDDGTVDVIKESKEGYYDGWLPYGENMPDEEDPNYLPFGSKDSTYMIPEETVLNDGPTDSPNGNDEIKVKDMDGFLYIKRCKTIDETMKKILDLIDVESSVYKENKSNSRNNFTFYVKDKKICIAHRDNPTLVNRRKKK